MSTVVSSNGLTIRQRIAAQIKLEVEDMVDGSPPKPVWQKVFTGDAEVPNNDTPYCSINQGEEVVIEAYGGRTIKELPFTFFFRWTRKKGVDVLDQYNYYLGLLQKTLLPLHENDPPYPLLRDIREESNNHYILGQEDAEPAGALVMIVQYDHAVHDPYKKSGE